MSRSLFWLSDETWTAIEPHLPKNQPGARRVDDRKVGASIYPSPKRLLRDSLRLTSGGEGSGKPDYSDYRST